MMRSDDDNDDDDDGDDGDDDEDCNLHLHCITHRSNSKEPHLN